MKIWLPYLRVGSGVDVFTEMLGGALVAAGHEAVLSPFARQWQYLPWRPRFAAAPPDTDVILANSWNGFAFKRDGCKLVVVEHHCVLDSNYAPYRSLLQCAFHETLVRAYEKASLRVADAVVAVSAYTARSLREALGGPRPAIIHNGVDTDFFCPSPQEGPRIGSGPCRLLFVGNLIRRKGADLLPEIMRRLGPGFQLSYTGGLRDAAGFADLSNMTPLGRLTRDGLRDAYRRADILLFPSRFEGFGYAAAEALSCGTPVVASACSSLPEIIEDGVTGRLCPVDDLDAFVAAVSDLAADPARLREMGRQARAAMVSKFSLARWVRAYIDLFHGLVGAK